MIDRVKFSSLTFLIVLLAFSACTSVQQSTSSATSSPLDFTSASMNKDAVRLSVVILKVDSPQSGRNVHEVSVKKLVKYGATFSSVEPKVDEEVLLLTPEDVTFQKGDVILIDVITPRIDDGKRPMKVRLA